ncbi:CRAL-TRIO domain-containing protein [Pilobolus umbonatus]|nr:CRAL-TRIO domain-containing protein [Pilobolus umbonatus]
MTLVSQFTSQETEAVQQLKQQLPEIQQEAFQSDEKYKLWNVVLDKDSNDSRLDVILVKFIRARNLDVSQAREMLVSVLKWRKSFRVDTILDEQFDTEVFNDQVGFIYKTDKKGRPVTYNRYGGVDQNTVFKSVDKFIRWRIQLMERGIQLLDFVHTDSIVQVQDVKGATLFGRTPNTKEATNQLIQLMQDNYPEFLAGKLFIHVPWWGSRIFKLIRPLLSEATTSKFVVSSR